MRKIGYVHSSSLKVVFSLLILTRDKEILDYAHFILSRLHRYTRKPIKAKKKLIRNSKRNWDCLAWTQERRGDLIMHMNSCKVEAIGLCSIVTSERHMGFTF